MQPPSVLCCNSGGSHDVIIISLNKFPTDSATLNTAFLITSGNNKTFAQFPCATATWIADLLYALHCSDLWQHHVTNAYMMFTLALGLGFLVCFVLAFPQNFVCRVTHGQRLNLPPSRVIHDICFAVRRHHCSVQWF